jgi:hypothetical protein
MTMSQITYCLFQIGFIINYFFALIKIFFEVNRIYFHNCYLIAIEKNGMSDKKEIDEDYPCGLILEEKHSNFLQGIMYAFIKHVILSWCDIYLHLMCVVEITMRC